MYEHKRIFDIGEERTDGKFNVWERVRVGDYLWEWSIIRVFDTLKDAQSWADMKRENKGHRQKGALNA